jgi:hypothetical protein
VDVDIQELEHRVETLWQILEDTQVIMDEMSAYFMEQKDFESQKLVMQESNELEAERHSLLLLNVHQKAVWRVHPYRKLPKHRG